MAALDVDHIHSTAGFGQLLRQHRLALGLTQETLAESAGLSAHAIQRLERGSTQPYRDTTERLIRALRLVGPDEVRFRTAARPAPRRRADAGRSGPTVDTPARHNLPHQATSFVGRQDDLARVQSLVRENRLVTVTGAGGCGKTRLALEVGSHVVDEFADGVWLVDLAPLSATSLVWQALAAVLGVREEANRAVADAVADYLRDRTVLIVLDNCEHLIDACARMVDVLLQQTASVRILATSRELLAIPGEATWRVRSLSVVDPRELAPTLINAADVLRVSEAARLFVDRAQLLNPSFELNDANASAVAQVCYRLDGIPLAIELAAARLTVLSIEEVAARLDQRFRLLTGGYRTAVRRQQTLEATIDWSYELLTDGERALLRSLAVFAGGWSLESAEAVGSPAVGPHEDVVEVLTQLARKSMVIVDDVRGVPLAASRYRFLETIRQYAEAKLVAAGEAEAARTRHAEWCIRLAEEAEYGMESADQRRWWDRLDLELDNLRAALEWIASQPDGDMRLVHLAGLLGRFWRARDHLQEGLSWLGTAVYREAPTPAGPSADRARALNWLAVLRMYTWVNWVSDLQTYGDDIKGPTALLEQGAAEARAVGDSRLLSLVLRHLGLAWYASGEYQRADSILEEALAVSREIGSKREIAWNLSTYAANLMQRGGDRVTARHMLEEAVALGRESGDLTAAVNPMMILGFLNATEGNPSRAREVCEDALALARQIDVRFMVPAMFVLLGKLAAADGDLDRAADLYHEAIRRARASAAESSLAHAIRHYAALLSARGEHQDAVRLLAATAHIHLALQRLLDAQEVGSENVLDAARSALGDRAYAEAWAEGEALSLGQATAEILDESAT